MVQNICKSSFSGGKSRKKWHSCNKNQFLCKKSPKITGFHELTPKLLSIIAGLIYHSCGL